jgi:hypothetical protein
MVSVEEARKRWDELKLDEFFEKAEIENGGEFSSSHIWQAFYLGCNSTSETMAEANKPRP